MSAAQRIHAPAIAPKASLDSAIEHACSAIAPSWPLDRQIAVNPFWGFIDRPFEQVADALGRLIGTRLALPPAEYRQAWNAGAITPPALRRALKERGSSATVPEATAALEAPGARPEGLPLLSDILDQHAELTSGPLWRDTITQQVSQYCASYFDQHQADWQRGQAEGLFQGWRNGLRVDHALEPLMHAPEIRARAQSLPMSADAAIEWSLDRLGLPHEDAVEFLQVCLLRIHGWASWCAYLRWQAVLAGAFDCHLRELLAIRVSWEALLHDGRCEADSLGSEWRECWSRARRKAPSRSDTVASIWQRAHEISYQDHLTELLTANRAEPAAAASASPPSAQLVFCIDVRSERFRRALESVDGTLETRGFAGFFGLPIEYRPIGTQMARPQLPGLLAPSLACSDTTDDRQLDEAISRRRADRLGSQRDWRPFTRLPSGTFSLVETLGLGYVGAILSRHWRRDSSGVDALGLSARDACALHPRLLPAAGDSMRQRAALVASILRAMSLTSGFARLLVLVGHGSQSANNPQAAALECGACGGQTGEINARVLAGLINDPRIRAELREQGIDIPASTLAIAALHNTTTDEVRLFDSDRVPASHAADLERLRRSLEQAGARPRAERAPSLGLAHLVDRPEQLLRQLRQRARDWAETRPEWGLADNAAFIVAPRSRTRGLDLGGRAFLHDYDWREDRDGKVLELIMTAPMVVTHWINLQYFASTVDPDRFGSGNKVLHNVVCGRIGVFEGNTGDLRIGLSRQSVHDGQRWMHTPLRLSVCIDAPREMIDGVLARHATVRHLVTHRWLHLFRFAAGGLEWHHEGRWQPWRAQGAVS